MSNSNPLLWLRPSVMMSYGIAILSVAGAVIIAQVPALHLQSAPVSLFLCAVMFSAWFGGVRPGLLAIFLSVLAFDYYFLPPVYSLALKPDEITRLVIFTLSALFVGSLSAAQKSAAESLRRGRDDLELMGQELQRSNEALRLENTERQQTEDALRQTEAYLAEAQRLSHTGCFGWNASSGELFWSEECFQIFEYDQTMKPTRKLVLQRVHPEDAALVKQTIERALQDGKDADLVHRLLMPDASVKYVHIVAHASRDESGRLEFVGAVMDVTERKLAEEEVRKQAELLSLAHDAIIVRDLESRVIFWNQGAENTYGWTAAEAIGRVTHELLQTRFPVSLEAVDMALREQGEWEGELTHITHKGTPIVVTSRQSLRRARHGADAAILEINRDITERKQAEEALHKAQAELAHITRVTTLGELTASIAHEVNQPLSAIVTNGSACLRWLAGDSPNLDEAREASRRIIREGQRAGEVISRIRAMLQKADTQKARFDMNDTIQDIVALAQSEVSRNRVTLRMELAADLPPVFGDRVQLQQVILNLLMNGVEAMAAVSDRPRELLIQSHAYESDHVLIAVQDCGVGITPEDQEKIFNAFYSTKPDGMGMGLAISRSIVEDHGGRLWVVPNESPGVTFQFTLLKYDSRTQHA
jgi:PAS domain S-box-containing protein